MFCTLLWCSLVEGRFVSWNIGVYFLRILSSPIIDSSTTTSFKPTIFLVTWSETLYAFDWESYPKSIIFYVLDSSLFLLRFGVWTYTNKPYILRWDKLGGFLKNISSGDFPLLAWLGVQFCEIGSNGDYFAPQTCMRLTWQWHWPSSLEGCPLFPFLWHNFDWEYMTIMWVVYRSLILQEN